MFGQEEIPVLPFTVGTYAKLDRSGNSIFVKIIHEATHIDASHTQLLGIELPDGSHSTISLEELVRYNPDGALLELPKNIA